MIMGVERMACCGVLTSVYRDAGVRKHNPGCVTQAGDVARTQIVSIKNVFSDQASQGFSDTEALVRISRIIYE